MTPSQRYFASSTTNSVLGETQDNAESDNENDVDDFMSDKFVAAASSASTKEPKSYTQMRKEALKRKEERGLVKSRADKEKEARDEGLKRSLLEMASIPDSKGASSTETTLMPASGNIKALDMMLKMGFKPGEALGKKWSSSSASASTSAVPLPPRDDNDEGDDEFIPVREGIGAKRSAASALLQPSTGQEKGDDRRLNPIEIQMRSGRAPCLTVSSYQYQS